MDVFFDLHMRKEPMHGEKRDRGKEGGREESRRRWNDTSNIKSPSLKNSFHSLDCSRFSGCAVRVKAYACNAIDKG